MKLVAFSPQYLRIEEPLPFGLRDASGRLLLAAGQTIAGPEQLAELKAAALYADANESADWNRRLAGAVDAAMRQGCTLGVVAAARPEAPRDPATVGLRTATLAEMWHEIVALLDSALRDVGAGADWLSKLATVHARARALFQRRPDASLYHMVYEAGHSTHKYSCSHALLVLAMSEDAAGMLGWPQDRIDTIGRAALTMNLSMMKLQDQLALTQLAPTPETRAEIDAHPEASAELLCKAGMPDALCIDVVRSHHDVGLEDAPLAAQQPAQQLARLLRRVDIFAAKISRRANRTAMSPVQAAREACLGAGGVPDEIGGALLKAVGLYPPGSFVELASGEVGIVVARGRRANLPYVAALMAASGSAFGEPTLRDTLDRRYSVKAAVPTAAVKVRPVHDRVLALRLPSAVGF